MFQLGDKYSRSMGATYMDEDGNEKPFLMGCYGVGVSRSLAAIVEQYNDEYGIKWPAAVAPAHVCILPLQMNDPSVVAAADRVAKDLSGLGLEVVIDDRDERPGVKFAEADLIGWPLQFIIGKRGVANKEYELKNRMTGEKSTITTAEYAEALAFAKRAQRPMHAFMQQAADVRFVQVAKLHDVLADQD